MVKKSYSREKINEFYSMCKMKNKHSTDDKEISKDYMYFESLYEGLRSLNKYLNQFSELGIIPDDKVINELEFGSKSETKETENPIEKQVKENIKIVNWRIERAIETINSWNQKKTKILDDPLEWKNFFKIQMLGKSLIKMNKNNFRFFVKYFESDLDIQSGENIDDIPKNMSTDERLEYLSRFFNTFKNDITEKISSNIVKDKQSLKFLKYIELPISNAYNYILEKFISTLKEKYSADQIFFCSWHSKWPQVESKTLGFYLYLQLSRFLNSNC